MSCKNIKVKLSMTLLAVLSMVNVFAYNICEVCEKTRIPDGKKICRNCQNRANKQSMNFISSLMSGMANAQARENAINETAEKLGNILASKKISNKKKVEITEKILRQNNAGEFYATIAANAPFPVIKYYWQDHKNERVYVFSKNIIEKYRNRYSKRTKAAFALGRAKKDNSIRYVDEKDFSCDIIHAALKNKDCNVLKYFLDQTGGFDWELRAGCLARILKERQIELKEKAKLTQELAAAEKKLQYADDKYEQKKYSVQVNSIKKSLAVIPKQLQLGNEQGKILFGDISRFELYLMTQNRFNLLRDSWGNQDSKQLMNAFKDILKYAAKYAPGDVARWAKARALDAENYSFVSDRELFGKNQHDYTSLPVVEFGGYLWQSIPSVQKMEWGAGYPEFKKPGYVSGTEKGSYVWKRGLPNIYKLGFISGAKENEWVPAPGFKRSGDKMVWVAGTKHPHIKGVIAGAKPLTWIPDKKHAWKKSRNPADLSVVEDGPLFIYMNLADK